MALARVRLQGRGAAGGVSAPRAQAWQTMINGAQSSIDIGCFYMTLTGGRPDLGGDQGQAIYDAIVAAAKRGVRVQIAITSASASFPQVRGRGPLCAEGPWFGGHVTRARRGAEGRVRTDAGGLRGCAVFELFEHHWWRCPGARTRGPGSFLPARDAARSTPSSWWSTTPASMLAPRTLTGAP